MYCEVWTKWPANLVADFETTAECEQWLQNQVEQFGLEGLKNHAVITVDENEDLVLIGQEVAPHQ